MGALTILVKGLLWFLAFYALLIVSLGLGCARLPTTGTVPAHQVQEP